MKRKGRSPTSRSLEYCDEKLGWIAGVVERRIPYKFITIDLFGCIDIVAIAGDRIIGIQATSDDNHASRRTKALAEPRLRAWLAAGGGFEVWSWGKKGAAGKRKLWTLRREQLELKMLPQVVPASEAA
ncbi:MAG TPA: hypothetical protein VET26_00755 [Candidatus Sulfotelmatobacter sp.]|nr:hypothetical protein [Candidatus Sulfotelmatobacter sp.]